MSDVNGSTGPGASGSHPRRGANWGDPAQRPHDFDESQRRQRNALIGLAVASAIVLLIGGVAFLASRSSATDRATLDSLPVLTAPPATVPDTTTTSTTTSTSTSTTTTLPIPVDAIADAGPDLVVDAGAVVTLEALAVTEDAEEDDVMWRQVAGPDVTAGVGALGGSAVSFGAPNDVVTLKFELVVTSESRAATAPEAVDALTVRVFEQADAAIFVDAERGSDAGDGTMGSPLQSLVEASRRAGGGADLYVRSVGTYSENEPIRLDAGSSLYGGFDENWDRDRAARIQVNAASIGIIVDGDGDRRISAVELTAADAEVGRRAIGVRVSDGENVTIEDSRIVAGRAGDGTGAEADALAGASVGVLVIDTGEIRLERSTVNSGRGGDGGTASGAQDRSSAPSGDDGNGILPGSGGEVDGDGDGQRAGGDGGGGASVGAGDDAPGDRGGAGGQEQGDDGTAGTGGAGGGGGRGGDGGVGLFGGDSSVPIGASGSNGDAGASGAGAGGGGGGASGFGVGLAMGGGGGGGGAGARGSDGGLAGGGGGGSIGVWAVGVDRVVIIESLVAAGRGGDGALGAGAGAAGAGGGGGDGVEGGNGAGGGGNGAGGGGGGAGGVGGIGGGGAGGPSSGMLTSDVGAVEIMATTIRGGGGGNGADGGGGGAAGFDGADGDDRNGGVGGSAGAGGVAGRGNGASGGSSFGWFDVDAAVQTFDGAEFIEGAAGGGGQGSTSGETGLEANANVDAG